MSKKYPFDKETRELSMSLLDEFIDSLTDEGRDEDADAIKSLIKFVESKVEQQERHYCFLCGAKRNSVNMVPYKAARFGKDSWICYPACNDSRFKKVNRRTPIDQDGNSKIEFTFERKRLHR